jgi:hypothetical protein
VVHDPDQHQPDGLGEVEGAGHGRVAEDRLRLAEVGLDEGHPPLLAAGHQGPGVGQHDRVVVHVDDPRLRGQLLGDLVDVARGRDAGPDVEELADAGLGDQEPHGPAHERPLGPHLGPDRRDLPGDGLAHGPVRGEVVLAAQPVVVHPGRLGHVGVDLRRHR